MGVNTAIQWCDDSENPTLGCGGCELRNRAKGINICYAGRMTDRFGGHHPGFAKRFDIVEKAPGRMALAAQRSDLTGTDRPDKPWLNGLPRLNFTSDMSDALSQEIDFDYLLTEIIEIVSSPLGQRHHCFG